MAVENGIWPLALSWKTGIWPLAIGVSSTVTGIWLLIMEFDTWNGICVSWDRDVATDNGIQPFGMRLGQA